MMIRPPLFMCFSAACVVTNAPRTLMSITRSISSSVVSSNVFGMAVPALFTRTSSRPNVATVFSTAALTALASAASAWIAIAFRPTPSISLTTDAAASAPFLYVMATFAPSAARRLAIAAPIPREPPVMSAIFPFSFLDIFYLLFLQSRSLRLPYGSDHGPTTFCEQPSLEPLFGYPMRVGANTTIEGERHRSSDHRCQYAFVRKAARQSTRYPVHPLPPLHLPP